MRCTATNRNGKPCGAASMTGRNVCYLHSQSGLAVQLGRRGGERRAVCLPTGIPEFSAPTNPAELRALVANVLVETRVGKLQPKIANSIALLAAVLIKATEHSELTARIKHLEAEWKILRLKAKPCNA
jgi:hypothetical protein